jgi:hypothetical protein
MVINTPASLGAWTINRVYPPTTVTATGGTGSYTWNASGLPGGMSIDPSTGIVSGTPTASGSFPVTVTVTDTASPAMTTFKNYTLTINPALSITTTACAAKQGKPINGLTLGRAGGTGPFTWSGSGQPGWVVVNPSGTLTANGNAPSSGTFAFTLTVTDAAGASNTVTFTITVVNGTGTC